MLRHFILRASAAQVISLLGLRREEIQKVHPTPLYVAVLSHLFAQKNEAR